MIPVIDKTDPANKKPRAEREIPDDIQELLKKVAAHYDQEDRYIRERQIRQWKKLKYYWNGFQRLWWSEVAHDWRVFDEQLLAKNGNSADGAFYDKTINIFRAYLESIIAALSQNVPAIECYPDDADNPLDISTARAGDKICELIYKHNNAPLLWMHALFIMMTEGLLAAYSYTKEDDEYGSYNMPEYKQEELSGQVPMCPNCGAQLGDPKIVDEAVRLDNQEKDEFAPDEDDVVAHDLLNSGQILCPTCLVQVDPELKEHKIIVDRIIGITSEPKSRQCIEVYGGLFVKVPNYAMKQQDCPYLKFSYETHYAMAISRYPKLKDKFTGSSKIGPGSGGMYDPYERWGRLSVQYYSEYPINTTTINNWWLRPESFNVLNSQEDVNKLKKRFPDGVKLVTVNDEFADAFNESLDDCWTILQNPLGDYIHTDPLGQLLTAIQEITNDLTALTIQTIEHGIPQTFADPEVLNFDAYSETEATPGQIFPAKPKSGKAIADAFYEVKTATLGQEVLPFAEKIQEAGQLVSGALPSLFGGASPNSSKTAAQYAMSRAQALQRLQITWKMLSFWWKDIFGKVIPAYIKDMVDDEHYVSKDKEGNFLNVFIKKAELQGRIGSVELEGSEELPITWAQQKDIVMQLLQGANPEVLAALTSPENIPILKRAIGLDDFIIPGEDDRQKQYEEIKILTESQPIPNTNQQGQQIESPSVEVEPLVDNHQIEADICRRWLVSDAGRQCKLDNQKGYKNVLLHMQQHMNILQVQAASAAMPSGQSNNKPNQQQPIAKGQSNGVGQQQSASIQ